MSRYLGEIYKSASKPPVGEASSAASTCVFFQKSQPHPYKKIPVVLCGTCVVLCGTCVVPLLYKWVPQKLPQEWKIYHTGSVVICVVILWYKNVLWYFCGTCVVPLLYKWVPQKLPQEWKIYHTGSVVMVQSLCGNPVVQKCPVVLLWYPCCTSEYHRNYHRNEKYTTQVLW